MYCEYGTTVLIAYEVYFDTAADRIYLLEKGENCIIKTNLQNWRTSRGEE